MNPKTYGTAVECLKEWAGGTPVKQIERERKMGKKTFYVLKQRFKRQFPDVFKGLLENVRKKTLQN